MDKKSIIGLVLIFGIFVGYMYWIGDTTQKQKTDNKEQAVATTADEQSSDTLQQTTDTLQQPVDGEQPKVESPAENDLARQTKTSLFKNLVASEGQIIPVTTQRMKVELNTLGAMINKVTLTDYQTYNKTPLVLITPGEDNLNYSFSDTCSNIETRFLQFKPFVNGTEWDGKELSLDASDSTVVAMRADIGSELDGTVGKHYLEFAYTFRGNSYEVDFDIHFVGLDKVIDFNRTDLIWKNRMMRQEKHREGARSERTYTSIYFKPLADDVDHLSDGNDDTKDLKTKLDWVAFKQQYFCAILTANSHPFENAYFGVHTDKETQKATPEYLTDMQTTIELDMVSTKSMGMGFYFGPTKYRDLKVFDQDFDKMLPLGWTFISKNISRWLIIPAFNFLEKFNWNYGIIIIVFTLIIRLLLLPLVYKSYRGGAIMRILKPEMDALNAKYPKKEQAMQKQQAMMALQKSAGYSPMAGCLPVLLQMPFLTAMFFFFPQAIELRQKSFLWCDDLSTYDSVLDLGFNIPLYGDHVSLFCLLMFGMQFFYTWYTMKQQASSQSMPGMKFVMYFMPFMMLFIFNSQSAGLNLYYLVSLTFTMTTMILIRKFTSEKKVRAHMAAYAKNASGKTQKKSRFQQRLEELQKQAEQMQKQKQQQQRRR